MREYKLPVFIEGLTKIFHPNKIALDNIDLLVSEGETIGILGNNGAGKTTLLRILATLWPPSMGTVEIFGLDLQRDLTEIKSMIGYLPERFSFYPYFSVEDILDFFERLTRLARTDQVEVREQIIKLLGLESFLQERISSLSKGMLQKVGLAITLIHDPPLLLLDEPTSGLDPLVRNRIRKILIDLSYDLEKTILISSHVLEDIEAICHRVFFLEEGKMIQEPFRVSEFKTKFSELQRLEIKSSVISSVIAELKDLDGVIYYDSSSRGIDIYCKKNKVQEISQDILERLDSKGVVKTHPITLEDVYILNHSKTDWLDSL